MKTLCYKLVFWWEGLIYNDGFIVVEIGDDAKLKNVEGLLTDDYVGTRITEDRIELTIYSRNDSGKLEQFFFLEGNIHEFELPLEINLKDEFGQMMKLMTKKKITDNIKKKKAMIKRFKENNVFEKERD